MVPSGFSFTLNTHLQPIDFLPAGRDTSDHVLFLKKAENSSVIAVFHYFFCKASTTEVGSKEAPKTLGLNTPALDLVTILGVFSLCPPFSSSCSACAETCGKETELWSKQVSLVEVGLVPLTCLSI